MAAGSIIIDLLMKTASFVTDQQRASKSLKQLQKDAEVVGKALGAAFIGGATGLAFLVKSSIDSADHLNDLSKKTGIAVDTLGGIGFAAGQAGGDLESAAAAAGKLNKSLAEAAAGNKQAQEAFRVLGISVKDANGQTKAADKVLTEIADRFADYADGPEKAALALRIFGKAGADIIPLLNDGGKALQDNIDYYRKYAGVSQEVAEKADAFNDTLGKLKLLSGSFGRTLTAELLDPLQNLADLWLRNKEQGDQFNGVASKIADTFKAITVAVAFVGVTLAATGDQLGAFAAKIVAFLKGDFAGAGAISADAKANLDQTRKSFMDFYDAIYKGRDKAIPDNYSNEGRNSKSPAKQAAPRLLGDDAAKQAADTLKKQLDGQLKLIADFQKAQAQAYAFGNTYLEGAYQDGLTSQRDYFETQKAYRELNLKSVLDAFDQEIKAQQAFIANPLSKPADRVAAQEKIKLASQQRAEAVIKANQEEALATQANARAVQQLQDTYDAFVSGIQAAGGDELGASVTRIAKQVREAAILVNQAGKDPAIVEQYKQQLQGIELLKDAQRKYTDLLHDQGNAEQLIYLGAEKAGKGELETLADVRDSRTVAIEQLRQMAEHAAALNAQFQTPDSKKFADDLAVALAKAQAELETLATKFNGIFEDSFSNAFAGFLTGTKSAKEAFRDFANSVIGEIANIAAKNLAKAVFGDTGGSSGLGGLLSRIFGNSIPATSTQTTYTGTTAGQDFSGVGFPLAATGTNRVQRTGLAVVHKDEAIIPKEYNPAVGGGGGPIQVVNNLGVAATAREERVPQSDGTVMRRLVLDTVAGDVGSGTGKVATAMRGRFGLGPGVLPRRN